MIIGYTIISVDDSRAENKEHIRSSITCMEEITDIQFVDGRKRDELERAIATNQGIMPTGWNPTLGEMGIWLSQMECWKYTKNELDALVVFEDDALIQPNFDEDFPKYIHNLPEDWDLLTICVPDNQTQDFYYKVVYDETGCPVSPVRAGQKRYIYDYGSRILSRVYQGYCCVATVYSKQGAEKLLERAHKRQIYTPVDCFLFLESHRRDDGINGYAPRPDIPRIVNVNWEAPTTVHNSERYWL